MASRALVLAPLGTGLSADEAAFFRDSDPWGFILFARNIADPEQVRRLTSDLRNAVGRDVVVMVDQEGGRVQRLRAPYWREWLPPLDQTGGERALWLRYAMIGAELRAVGIDTNCAPCADIAGADTHPFLRNRCLGTDPNTVALRARAVADGLMAGGCLPVVKHMPGHGRAVVDSHLHLPRVSAGITELLDTDFAPFKALNDLPMAMTAHIVFDAIDPNAPATCSPIMMSVMRDQIGFGGLMISDDLSMQALAGSVAERAIAALSAGCDLALHCNGKLDEMQALAEDVGLMTLAATTRANAALAFRPFEPCIDIARFEEEFRALCGQAA
jgi:beta-N-acetylhexosaminidase